MASQFKIHWGYDGASIEILDSNAKRIVASLDVNINSAILSEDSKLQIKLIAKEALEKIVPLLPALPKKP